MKLPLWTQIFAERRQVKWHAFLFITGMNINCRNVSLPPWNVNLLALRRDKESNVVLRPSAFVLAFIGRASCVRGRDSADNVLRDKTWNEMRSEGK
jgi:hypothetical protein